MRSAGCKELGLLLWEHDRSEDFFFGVGEAANVIPLDLGNVHGRFAENFPGFNRLLQSRLDVGGRTSLLDELYDLDNGEALHVLLQLIVDLQRLEQHAAVVFRWRWQLSGRDAEFLENRRYGLLAEQQFDAFVDLCQAMLKPRLKVQLSLLIFQCICRLTAGYKLFHTLPAADFDQDSQLAAVGSMRKLFDFFEQFSDALRYRADFYELGQLADLMEAARLICEPLTDDSLALARTRDQQRMVIASR